VPKTNGWHPVMLPDDYLRKLTQDLAEADEAADSATRREPDPELADGSLCDKGQTP
jgi:hypothetical protein